MNGTHIPPSNAAIKTLHLERDKKIKQAKAQLVDWEALEAVGVLLQQKMSPITMIPHKL